MPLRILILCTGNSCRSQMAEGFLKSFDADLEVYSAGTRATGSVHPMAIEVMREAGVDIREAVSKDVERFIDQSFDFVVTVCDNARQACPVFTGRVRHRVHMGFDDPCAAWGTKTHIKEEFRRVRDEIRERFHDFYVNVLKGQASVARTGAEGTE